MHNTVIVCLSVRPSVTSRSSAIRRLNLESRKQLTVTLVCQCQRSRQNSNGVTPNEAQNRGSVGSDPRFSTSIWLCLRNGARCSDMVTVECIATRVCSVEWRCFLWLPFSKFCIAFHIFVLDGGREFKFGRQPVDGSKSCSRQMTNHPWKGRGQVAWII